MKNKTLTKNMPNVKWDQLPPRKGPNPQGRLNGNNKNVGKQTTRVVLPSKRTN
jgi:hypothetical protein